MNTAIKEVIDKHVCAYLKQKGKYVLVTQGTSEVADELGITYEAAKELIQSWIYEEFR